MAHPPGPPHWGWHRLAPRAAERLVADAGIRPGALVLDLGAGHGAVTAALLDAGTHVIAVELHPQRARVLRDRFGDRVTVVIADVADLRLPTRPYHVVANPPFGASTAILRRLLQPGSRLVSAALVLPVPVVRRWSGPTAPAAARWRRTFDATAGRTVAPTSFHPPAPAPARVLHLRRRAP